MTMIRFKYHVVFIKMCISFSKVYIKFSVHCYGYLCELYSGEIKGGFSV